MGVLRQLHNLLTNVAWPFVLHGCLLATAVLFASATVRGPTDDYTWPVAEIAVAEIAFAALALALHVALRCIAVLVFALHRRR